ncbi:TrbI/VirB10 family protein [Candidatus Cyanaurora vandensis]|uniref:TrbI/VirB10 family protein n=1 Tax=Candidatus Cyanaurora vandensis TaxID=2714958 RepID=UPI00257B99A9|nr:TrbI/VirB10 family protein [Candidatus Cyanaurora vandensis]
MTKPTEGSETGPLTSTPPDTTVPPVGTALDPGAEASGPPTPTTEPVVAPAKAMDGANRANSFKQTLFGWVRPLLFTENAVDGKYYLDTTKVTIYIVAGVLLAGGGAGWALLSMRRPPTPVPVAAKPVQPAVPDPKAVPIPQPVPVAGAVVPQPAPGPPQPQPLPVATLPARALPSALVKPTARELKEQAQREALAMVQLRSANRTPYTGVAGSTLPSLPAPGLTPLPPPPSSRAQTVGYTPPQTGSYPPSGYTLPPTASYPTYAQAQNNPAFQSAAVGSYNPTPNLSAGVQRTSAWSLVPPGNWVRVRSRSLVQLLKGRQGATVVLASVAGPVTVDGREVIPDGAMLTGTVNRLDEGLGRVYLQFNQLSFNGQSYPLPGANAWVLNAQGDLAEGLALNLEGQPNYLVSDGTSALGTGAAQFAQSYGQSVTTTTSSLTGAPYQVASQSGDINTALTRAAADGVSSVFTRQTQRADRSANQLESRGAIYTLPTGTEFVVYLPGGI